MSAAATVMITTGGTGGHVFPGLAVAAKLVARGVEVFWLGTRDGIEARLVPAHGVAFEGIPFGGIRGKGARQWVFGPFALLAAFARSLSIIRRRAPDVVLAFGGYASFPGALIGVACAKPLVLHEANAVAGLANRILAYGADRILLGFADAFSGRHVAKTALVGNPLREEMCRIDPPALRFAAREGPLRLLVVGGSLGAAGLNERLPPALALMPAETRPRVVHQSGERHQEALRACYARAGVEAQCVPFIVDMARAYADADLVVCRGGAITVSEIAAIGVGAIIVPLPGAIADEQTANARLLVGAGAAVSIPERDLSPARLAAELTAMSRTRALAMATAARGVARLDAAERVAEACIRLAVRP